MILCCFFVLLVSAFVFHVLKWIDSWTIALYVPKGSIQSTYFTCIVWKIIRGSSYAVRYAMCHWNIVRHAVAINFIIWWSIRIWSITEQRSHWPGYFETLPMQDIQIWYLLLIVFQIQTKDFKGFQYEFNERMIDGNLCLGCNKMFSSASNVSRHYKEMHLGVKYLCHECPRAYKSVAYLKAHYSKKHEGSRIPASTVCIVYSMRLFVFSSPFGVQ